MLLHKGKMHYLPKESWVSRCGSWNVPQEDQKYIHFIPKSELMKGKACKQCERSLMYNREM